MKLKLGLMLFCLSLNNLFAQSEQEINALKKLGNDSLIKLAVSRIKEPGFDAKGYDRIVVKAYKDKLVVDFGLAVVFKSGCYYDAVYVALVGNGTGASIQGDCDKPKYHKISNAEKKKLEFIFDSINKSDEIGHMKDHKVPAGSTMEITEELTHYHVEMSDWSTHSVYNINKITGKISDANHKHYARDQEQKTEFEIVK